MIYSITDWEYYYLVSDTSQCCAVLGIAALFREKTEKIISFEEDDEEDIQLKLYARQSLLTMDDKTFCLKLEGTVLFECDTFLELITGLMATIYTFNLVYPKVWEKTLTFIQNVILGLKDGDRIDKKNVSVLTDINREIKSTCISKWIIALTQYLCMFVHIHVICCSI